MKHGLINHKDCWSDRTLRWAREKLPDSFPAFCLSGCRVLVSSKDSKTDTASKTTCHWFDRLPQKPEKPVENCYKFEFRNRV
jgi:hypothetical protein